MWKKKGSTKKSQRLGDRPKERAIQKWKIRGLGHNHSFSHTCKVPNEHMLKFKQFKAFIPTIKNQLGLNERDFLSTCVCLVSNRDTPGNGINKGRELRSRMILGDESGERGKQISTAESLPQQL